MDRIIQLHVPEAATRQLMVSRGEVDIVHGLDAAQITALSGDSNVAVTTSRIPMTVNFLADLRAEPLQDVRVRQALRYAIDYEGLKTVVAGGFGEVLQTNILPGMPGYEPEMGSYYSYDPERAKELLAEAGYPDGFEITLVSRDGSVGTLAYSKAVTYWQQNLAGIGVRASILEMTSANMWGQISEGSLDGIGISGAGATVFDPDHPASIRAVQESNLLGWEEIDPEAAARAAELAEQGVRELDVEKRAAIYAEISRLMVERSPYWTFMQVVEPVVHRSDVSGVVFSPGAQPIDLKYIVKP
jgi:peptide/nickel transport system substrate-binding protein